MYQVGDLIFYGSTGVCRIEDIVERSFAGRGNKQLYYVFRPLSQDCVISVPVGSDKVFIRPVITREEADRLIDAIPSIKAEVFQSHALRQLVDHYEAALKTHDCRDLIELTMSIHAKKELLEQQKKKIGTLDERFMKRAEDLLFGELSVALGIPKEAVPEYIQSRLSGSEKPKPDAGAV